MKRGGSLSDNVSLLFNGSLLLQNVSLENEGTYVCTATNALGQAMATSVLQVLGECWAPLIPGFPLECMLLTLDSVGVPDGCCVVSAPAASARKTVTLTPCLLLLEGNATPLLKSMLWGGNISVYN